MRRPRFVLTSAIAAVGLSAGIAIAQQQPPNQGTTSSTPVVNADPMYASKAARYLLRNGIDYLAYREYDRALSFLRAAEARQNELTEAERAQLKKEIAKVQDAKRAAVNGTRLATVKNGRATAIQPGAIALARPPKVDNLQRTAATLPDLPGSAASPAPALVEPAVVAAAAPAVVPMPEGLDLPALPAPPQALPDLSPQPVAAPVPDPVPSQVAPPVEALPGADLPSLPSLPTPLPMPETVPAADPSAMPAGVSPPMPPEPTPAPTPAPVVSPLPEPAPYQAPAQVPVPEPVPAPEASSLPTPAPAMTAQAMSDASGLGNAELHRGSLLSPRLRKEIEDIERLAQRPTGADSVTGETADPNSPISPTQGSTRLELTRAPSPTEARPLRKIPVPEEFVPLPPRKWDPARKYWSAAGTCHMPLYFQDPVLERYGQGVEQSLGRAGRFFSYPLDDPRQSNQRNQILQPFYSMGKFAFQVGTLPYKMLMDPPWEAEYDLGYYRPGDKIPADTIMITPYGVGPPLKGRNY